MNKFCMFFLFACVANSCANDYGVGQPKYETYSVPAPTYGSGASHSPNPVVELAPYDGPEVLPASYSHAAHAKYSSDNAHLPVNTYGNIHGSKTVKARWESVNPLAKSYAEVQKPKAPKGKYQQYAVPGFRIVEIVVEPNYDSDKHYPAPAPPAAPAYQHSYVPAAPAYKPAAKAYAPAPAAPAYAPASAPAAHAYAPAAAPAAHAYGPAPAPAAPAYAPAPAPAAHTYGPAPESAPAIPAYAPAIAIPEAPACTQEVVDYAPTAPASKPTYISSGSKYAIVSSEYAPLVDDYSPSGPDYSLSPVGYATAGPTYSSKTSY